MDPNDCDGESQYSILSLNDYKNIWDQVFASIVNERNGQEANILVNGKSLTELRTEMFRQVFEIPRIWF